MGLWWLEPGWKDACCGRCGANIAGTGGDPDWGLCWPCMQHNVEQKEAERRYHREMETAYYAQMAGDEEYESWMLCQRALDQHYRETE